MYVRNVHLFYLKEDIYVNNIVIVIVLLFRISADSYI